MLFAFSLIRMVQRNIQAGIDDPIKYTKNIPDDYFKLLGSNVDFFLVGTIEGRFRNSISEFNYHKNNSLFIYKIDTSAYLPLREIIHEEHSNDHRTYNYVYSTVINNDTLEINYISKPIKKGTSIYINTYGLDDQTLIKNDTVAYYYSNINNFSIRYGKFEPQDFFGKVNDKYIAGNLPLEILFLKKRSNLYLILMAPNNGSTKLETFELYNLVVKNKY
jgi:hypothetical protein